MKALDGKVALVTGAGRGLGEAIALTLARAGADVAAADINGEAAASTARAIRDLGSRGIGITMDVSSADSVTGTVREVAESIGPVSILVNNAGIDHTLSISEMTVEQWDQVIGVNLRGAFLTSKAVLPMMQKQGDGYIINVASTAALRAWPNAAAYHASKWGLVGFTRALGVEGRRFGIRASALIPGGMRTQFFDRLEVKPDPGNLQDPKTVADLVVFMVSLPKGSVIQETLITPFTETSWP